MSDLLELKQGNFLSKKIHVTVHGRKELIFNEKRKFRTASVQFPLEQISPQPNELKEVSIGWIFISSIFAFVTISAFSSLISDPKLEAVVITVMFFLISLACILNTIQLSQNVLIYKSNVTGQFLFAIMRKYPSTEAVDSFVSELKKRIEAFRTPDKLSPEDSTELYMRHLDYLFNEEVITREEHDKVVNRLNEKTSRTNILNIVR